MVVRWLLTSSLAAVQSPDEWRQGVPCVRPLTWEQVDVAEKQGVLTVNAERKE